MASTALSDRRELTDRGGAFVVRGEAESASPALLARLLIGRMRSSHSVSASGVESEAQLRLLRLHQLLLPSLHLLPSIARPQRRALEMAFGLAPNRALSTSSSSAGHSRAGLGKWRPKGPGSYW